jgi:hypothetical protein
MSFFMTKMKTLSAAVILSTIIAAPVFAKDVGAVGRGSRNSLERQHHVRPIIEGIFAQTNGTSTTIRTRISSGT